MNVLLGHIKELTLFLRQWGFPGVKAGGHICRETSASAITDSSTQTRVKPRSKTLWECWVRQDVNLPTKWQEKNRREETSQLISGQC